MIGVLQFWSINEICFGLYIEYIEVAIVSAVHRSLYPWTARSLLREKSFIGCVINIELYIECSKEHTFLYIVLQVEMRRHTLGNDIIGCISCHRQRIQCSLRLVSGV